MTNIAKKCCNYAAIVYTENIYMCGGHTKKRRVFVAASEYFAIYKIDDLHRESHSTSELTHGLDELCVCVCFCMELRVWGIVGWCGRIQIGIGRSGWWVVEVGGRFCWVVFGLRIEIYICG